MKILFVTLGITCILAVLRMAGIWALPWVWVTAPVWGTAVLAVGLAVWVWRQLRK